MARRRLTRSNEFMDALDGRRERRISTIYRGHLSWIWLHGASMTGRRCPWLIPAPMVSTTTNHHLPSKPGLTPNVIWQHRFRFGHLPSLSMLPIAVYSFRVASSCNAVASYFATAGSGGR